MQTERRFLDVRLCVDDIVTTAPAEPVVGKQYLIANNATGDFAGKDNQIAYYSPKGWKYTIPTIGQLEVFNVKDLKFYRYETAGWVAYDVASSRVKDPVIAMVKSGLEENLPTTCEVGEIFIATDTGKVFTAAEKDDFGTGVASALGDRYASTTDAKIYNSTGTSFVSETVLDTVMFVSKADDNIYAYDADSATFRNLTSIQDNPLYRKHTETVVHTLTAAEITAKAFDLPKYAEIECGVLLSIGGVIQTPTTDFVVENNTAQKTSTLTWDGKGIEDIHLVEGDVCVISFSTIH